MARLAHNTPPCIDQATSSVHFVAALRMLAAAAGAGEATSVSAHAVQVRVRGCVCRTCRAVG